MYLLRTLSIRDVGNALVRREFGLAFRISQNLGSNAVNSVRLSLAQAHAFADPPCDAGGIMIPRGFWIARAITGATASALQVVGLYAAAVTFGAWTTVALYMVWGSRALAAARRSLEEHTMFSLGHSVRLRMAPSEESGVRVERDDPRCALERAASAHGLHGACQHDAQLEREREEACLE